MITLQEIFDDLASTSLSSLSLVDKISGTISPTAYPKVVVAVNLALTAIHKRFPLRIGEIIVQQYPDIIRYKLHSDFATSNIESIEPIKYISDSVSRPFQDDIIKIEQVFSETGEEYIINDSKQVYPIFTPEFDVLTMLPTGSTPQAVFVIYRAKYPKIKLDSTFNPKVLPISIPDFILDALYAKIASYVFKGMNPENGQESPGRGYDYTYELECKRLELENVTADDNDTRNNFEDRGWK